MEETDRSGVWLFRGAFQGKNLFSSLDVAGDWERKGSYHTAWAVIPHALVRTRMDMAPLSGRTLESSAGHC